MIFSKKNENFENFRNGPKSIGDDFGDDWGRWVTMGDDGGSLQRRGHVSPTLCLSKNAPFQNMQFSAEERAILRFSPHPMFREDWGPNFSAPTNVCNFGKSTVFQNSSSSDKFGVSK